MHQKIKISRYALFAVVLTFPALTVSACDFCHAVYGINPSFTFQNRLMMNQLYQRSRFSGIASSQTKLPASIPQTMHAGHGANLLDGYREQRLSTEIAYQHLLSNRVLVQVSIPVIWNRVQGASSYNISGNGDLQITGYRILKPYEKLDGAVTILAGGGLKLPTGPTRLRDESGFVLPMHAQPGSGSVDGLAHLIGFYQIAKHTFAADVFGKINSEANGFRRGYSTSLSFTVSRDAYRSFYEQVAFVPSLGLRLEQFGSDRLHGIAEPGGNIRAGYGTVGTMLIYRAMRVQTSVLLPVSQHRDSFSPREVPRFSLSIQHVFP